MKFKETVWLGAVLLIIGLFYFFIELPNEQKKQDEKERSETLLHFNSENVDSISLVRKDQTLVLERLGQDDWQLTHPLEDKADYQTAENILYGLSAAKFIRVVEESSDDLALFGLSEPALKITVKLKDRSEKTLLLGDDHPIGKNIYVKTGDQPRVLLAPIFKEDLDKSLYDVRDKTLMDFSPEHITRAVIRNNGNSIEMTRDGEEGWKLSGEINAAGDSNKINRLLNSLLSAKIVEFVDEDAESLAQYGLDAPSTELTLEREGSREPLSLRVGADRGHGKYFAQTSARRVFLLNKKIIEQLSRNPTDFMDKSLVDFKEDDVVRLDFSHEEQTVQLMRDDKDNTSWDITQPETGRADTATINSLWFDLKDARIKEFVKSSIQEASLFGLASPKKQLRLQFTDNSSWTLKLGNATSDGENFFAMRENEATVFVLPKTSVDKIFRSLHDLKDKRLLSFDEEEVHRVDIRTSTTAFKMIKEGNGWSLVAPEEIGELKEFLPKDILWTLARLEYQSVVDSKVDPGVTTLTITLFDSSNQSLQEVVVAGKATGDPADYYARIKGDPSLYTISKRFLDEIPSELAKFQN